MRTASPSLFLTLAITAVLSSAASGQLPPSTRIVVLAPDAADVRLELVSEAIEFWNETFAELGLEPVLPDAEVVVGWPAARTLENYAWQVSRGAGRHLSGAPRPAPPSELGDLEAEVVVLLSRQGLMPFAWPIGPRDEVSPPEGERYFVAIPPLDDPSESGNDTRNVIAHEIGHTLGLTHRDDPTTLMCMPCQPGTLQTRTESAFLQLAPQDRSRLAQLYPKDGD